MLMGGFVFVIPLLGLAGKQRRAFSRGAVPTHGEQFVGLLAAAILVVGGLAYLPAVALGPVGEEIAMAHGILYPPP